MGTSSINRVIFYDVEASGLNGYPIEVGWAVVLLDELGRPLPDAIQTESHLIRHDPWLEDARLWDYQAENVHRIPRAELIDNGKTPADVAARMGVALGGQTLYSDNILCDGRWTAILLQEARLSIPAFGLADIFKAFFGRTIDKAAWKQEITRFNTTPTPHRADLDALRWARIFQTCVTG